jgi:hypothetical protein
MQVRKTVLQLVCLIMGLAVVTSAADKANFNGTWVRDARSSDVYTAIIAPIIGRSKDLPGANFILRVGHNNKNLQVSVEQDGKKPEVANYDLGPGRHNSTSGKLQYEFGGSSYRSEWKGGNLVIYKNAGYRGNYGYAGGNLEQEWMLSPGRNVLTITTTINQHTTKEVFNRK